MFPWLLREFFHQRLLFCHQFRRFCLPSPLVLLTKSELTTVLSSAVPGVSSPVDSSPVIVGPTTRVVAASSDSESQEGETDPPA